jgi:hypothetical protein
VSAPSVELQTYRTPKPVLASLMFGTAKSFEVSPEPPDDDDDDDISSPPASDSNGLVRVSRVFFFCLP